MRTIEPTSAFRKDLKREKKGVLGTRLDRLLFEIIRMLAADIKLPGRCRDHAMIGDWADFRDCHIRPDLVLIYRKVGSHNLQLVRLGSHSDLGI